jgi:3-hydroxybutyrate dehydrogenase
MSAGLKGKTAVVTGATGVIGGAIARALAAAGADIVASGFGAPDATAKLCAELKALSGGAAIHSDADLGQPAGVALLIDLARRHFGEVDILVNNAGTQHVAPIEDFPPEKWDEIVALNLSAAFHAIRAVVAGMKARRWGRIVNIASVHGLVASADKSAYVAAKHGLVGLTRAVALETAAFGVTCNAICPGWVDTPLVRAQIDVRAAREKRSAETVIEAMLAEKQPSRAFVAADQIGALAAFLCSPAAAAIAGAAIPIDGGWLAQ